MPEGTGRLLQCGHITDFSLMIELNILQTEVAEFTHHTVVVFYATLIVCYFIGLFTVYNMILTAAEGSKHCQPSSTSFGLVDRFKGNYSANVRANSSSG